MTLLFAAAAEKIPDLRPPLGEIPPGYWEQHSTGIVIGSAFGVVVVIALALWLLRKKPPVVFPPAVIARQGLERLRGRSETFALASEASLIMRHYVLAKLGHASDELTTEELTRILASDWRFEKTAPALVTFLRDCDVQKFAPAIAPQPDVVARAFELVELFESTTQRPPPAA